MPHESCYRLPAIGRLRSARDPCETGAAGEGGASARVRELQFAEVMAPVLAIAAMPTISIQARQELAKAIRERYVASSATDKHRILDEFVALTGYHRKHAIRVLRSTTSEPAPKPRPPRSRMYDEAVREALVVLWEASDRICGKRLKALLPVLLPALENHGHVKLEDDVRRRLLTVSASTIDRLLTSRRQASRRRQRKTPPRVARSAPLRAPADSRPPEPGFLEIDLVAHGGDRTEGGFAQTLVLTDIASRWTECVALLMHEETLLIGALDRLRAEMPFPLRGIDRNHGAEPINEAVLAYCDTHGIVYTRSRPHHETDPTGGEQKTGAVVRRLVGHGRLEGPRAVEALARLYAASRLFVNFFQPSFKLAGKTRLGARVSKRYHAPETPCARLLASPSIDERMKERLRAVLATLDPLRLLDEIRTVQQYLAGLARGDVQQVLPDRDADLDRSLRSLATAWKRK